jgi:IMP cyclohydrolase
MAWLGIVRHDAFVVKAISLEVGQGRWIATYEANDVRDEQCSDFDAANATEAAIFVVSGGDFMELTHPVTSAAALAGGSRFELACHSI